MTSNDPASEDLARYRWAVWHDAIRRVIHAGGLDCGLSMAGLGYVRQELRRGLWRAELVPASHRTQHAELLNDITERIVATMPHMREYFVGAGDLHPPAPDDGSGLLGDEFSS